MTAEGASWSPRERAARGNRSTMRVETNGDELFLALVSMIQVTRPSLLTPAGDGFDVDIAPLLGQKELNEDERLVLRLYEAFSRSEAEGAVALDLSAAEGARLGRALSLVENARAWPEDATQLCRALRLKLEA